MTCFVIGGSATSTEAFSWAPCHFTPLLPFPFLSRLPLPHPPPRLLLLRLRRSALTPQEESIQLFYSVILGDLEPSALTTRIGIPDCFSESMEAANFAVSRTKLLDFRSRRSIGSLYSSRHKGGTSVCYVKCSYHSSHNGPQGTDESLSLLVLSNPTSDVSKGNFAKSIHIPVKRHNLGRLNCSAEACTHDANFLSISSHAHERVGILLLNLGGPETLNDVQPFLFNLFADPDIIRLPRLFRFLQRPLAKLISVVRAPKSKEGYAAIGGGSPLRRITDEQAQALKLALKDKDLHANVYVGMRYWYPFTEEALHQIKKDKITKLVVLPLYPQFSISTSGSSIRVLQRIIREDAYFASLPISIIESWYQREGYIKSMADLIENELLSFSKPEEVMIFFSAHGVPLSYVQDAGDPYKDQMEECISLIMAELKYRGIVNQHTLAYQSRVGPVQWLKPYTDEVIVELGQKGVKSLLAVPVSFVSEHIETLEEIDMEYKHLALQSGIENWGRVPALGCTSSFISDLADAVIEALPSASVSNAKKTSSKPETETDLVQYVINLFFGSIFAFVLLLSPGMISAFRNFLI
ncbi:Catalyzes the ferrous insertion into protoporphyrin IX (By similarity) [Musa troglodytarum]|uniref:Ferrochelatase n=1 Tax=Musa troglodytarum TaxID=320322 RepID=A0A9E7GMI0_9LILI|nr:Catalyzes the ferrous insertion into protoporphyrin IX (By similarity) [Musa troglodytarum]